MALADLRRGQWWAKPAAAAGGLVGFILTMAIMPQPTVTWAAEPTTVSAASSQLCPPPVLTRLTHHRIRAGETINSIAQQYGLMAATVIGLNPSLQSGQATVGQELLIPPYNGIRVSVSPGQTWEQIAATYNTRADVLFEVNGCVSTVPATIFVPGINWFPGVSTTATSRIPSAMSRSPLQGYPLPSQAEMIVNYGWQPDANQNKLVFHTGVALASTANTPVLAVGDGTVAFAGVDPVYANLVVVNHAQGLQTRYANLETITVVQGQRVRQGDRLGLVAARPDQTSSFLFFEVRLNSPMGWVAQDPQDHVPAMTLR